MNSSRKNTRCGNYEKVDKAIYNWFVRKRSQKLSIDGIIRSETFRSLLVARYFLLVTFCSLLVTFCSLLVTFCSLLVTFCSLLVTFCSLFVTFCSLLVTFARCSLLFARCSSFLLVAGYFLLVSHYFLLVARYFLLVIFSSKLLRNKITVNHKKKWFDYNEYNIQDFHCKLYSFVLNCRGGGGGWWG